MAKEWKSGFESSPLGDARLWSDSVGGTPTVYCLRIGWREYYFTRGEVILTLIVGLFAGFIYAAAQAGYLRFPDHSPEIGVYEPPAPVLLGSTESTRPEAGDPDVHFVDARGRAAQRPATNRESAAPASGQEPATAVAPPSSSLPADPLPAATGTADPVPVV